MPTHDALTVHPATSRAGSFDIIELSQPRSVHVFQRLTRLSEYFDTRDPYWAEIVSASELIAVADHYGFEREVARSLRLGRTTYVAAIRDGLFTRLLATLQGYDPVDVEGTPGKAKRPFPLSNPIVVGELHCPTIEGAKATFEATASRATRIGVEISAAGIAGGGGTRERVFASTSKLTIAAPQCAVLLANLSGHYEIWKRVGTEDDFLLLTNVTGTSGLEADDLNSFPDYADSHLCDKPWAFDRLEMEIRKGTLVGGEDYREFRTPVTEEQVDRTDWEETFEYSGRWGFEPEAGHRGLGGAVTYTSTFTTKIGIEVTCPQGYHYISRFRSSRQLPQQWAAKRLGGRKQV